MDRPKGDLETWHGHECTRAMRNNVVRELEQLQRELMHKCRESEDPEVRSALRAFEQMTEFLEALTPPANREEEDDDD